MSYFAPYEVKVLAGSKCFGVPFRSQDLPVTSVKTRTASVLVVPTTLDKTVNAVPQAITDTQSVSVSVVNFNLCKIPWFGKS